jgi:hypothetical protein
MKSRGGLKLYLLGNDDKEKKNIRNFRLIETSGVN